MGEGNVNQINFESVTTLLSNLTTALKDWVSTAMPYIIGIAASFFAFYLVRVVIRLVRSASK